MRFLGELSFICFINLVGLTKNIVAIEVLETIRIQILY